LASEAERRVSAIVLVDVLGAGSLNELQMTCVASCARLPRSSVGKITANAPDT
jgi:hypothetical protein